MRITKSAASCNDGDGKMQNVTSDMEKEIEVCRSMIKFVKD